MNIDFLSYLCINWGKPTRSVVLIIRVKSIVFSSIITRNMFNRNVTLLVDFVIEHIKPQKQMGLNIKMCVGLGVKKEKSI